MQNLNSYKKGMWAEYLAIIYLWCRGYKIIRHRYKTNLGEIDIIARSGSTLLCIEVKYRPDHTSGLEAVSEKSQRRIMNAARTFLSQSPGYENYDIRFDVVTMSPPFHIRHLQNAWYAI